MPNPNSCLLKCTYISKKKMERKQWDGQAVFSPPIIYFQKTFSDDFTDANTAVVLFLTQRSVKKCLT